MRDIGELIDNSLCAGAVATVTTGLTVAAGGQAEIGNPVAPLNAISHIVWGDAAAWQDDASAQYTLTGVALNGAAMVAWAGVHEAFFGDAIDRGDVVASLMGGALVSGLAYVTDYYVVPKRLTPGFEKRLSGASMFGVYAVLAVSLGLGRILFGGPPKPRYAL